MNFYNKVLEKNKDLISVLEEIPILSINGIEDIHKKTLKKLKLNNMYHDARIIQYEEIIIIASRKQERDILVENLNMPNELKYTFKINNIEINKERTLIKGGISDYNSKFFDFRYKLIIDNHDNTQIIKINDGMKNPLTYAPEEFKSRDHIINDILKKIDEYKIDFSKILLKDINYIKEIEEIFEKEKLMDDNTFLSNFIYDSGLLGLLENNSFEILSKYNKIEKISENMKRMYSLIIDLKNKYI